MSCVHCLCPDCSEIRREAEAKQRLVDAAAERMRQRVETRRLEHEANRDLVLREQCMIWLLVVQAESNEGAQQIMYDVACALDYRSAHVNSRRQRYAKELVRRAEQAVDAPWWHRLQAARALGDAPHTFSKIPGSQHTELPPDTWPRTRR